jgi:hypothetical protein
MQYLTDHGLAGERGAHISDCGSYRYRLWREWDRCGTQHVRAAIRYSVGEQLCAVASSLFGVQMLGELVER